MSDGGIYQILLHLDEDRRIRIGALGTFGFCAGWYVYTGSMRRGLRHRLRRHRAREKPLRWHIDYLSVVAPVVGQRTWPLDDAAGRSQECATHRALATQPGVIEPVKGFGSSDCDCPSHLVRLPVEPEPWPSIDLE